MSNMDNFVSIQISYRKIWLIGRPRENLSYDIANISDSFTILGLWVLGLAVSHINESKLQTYMSPEHFF